MILPKLVGRGLFVFSDPGGAKPILSLINAISSSLTSLKVVSDRHHSFYKDFEINVDSPDIISDINDFKPDFIFTGTSYTSDIELQYIQAAKDAQISVYSFVDHWTSIRQRFQIGQTFVVPDIILVPDERAKKIAISEGIEKEIMSIFPNPYHTFLKNWTPQVSRNFFFNENNISTDAFVVVFAPDPLSNAGGFNKFNTDEKIIAEEFIGAIREIRLLKKLLVILKVHPNQDINYILPVFQNSDIEYLCLKDIDTRCLLFFADLVVGIFSNILTESQILGKKVIRILGDSNTDCLESHNIGIVCKTQDQLIKVFQQEINNVL